MSSDKPPSRFVPFLPLDPNDLGIYLELEEEVTDSPLIAFVRLIGDSPRTRCLRGALVSASGSVITPVVVKLRQEEAAEGFFPEDELEGLDASRDEWWVRTLADLALLQGDTSCFPELLLPAPDCSPLPTVPPLLFCTLLRRLFAVFCPTCLGPLRSYRAGTAPAAAGLPLSAGTEQRYLSCPQCRQEGRETRLWAVSPPVEATSGEVAGSFEDLQRAWAEAATRFASGTGHEGPAPPCLRCAMSATCLGGAPGGEATGRRRAKGAASQPLWNLFSSTESPYIVTRLVPASLEAFADRLGGRPDTAIPGLPDAGGFIFGDAGSGLDAVEILTLKLSLFLQILGCVREYHLRLRLPHLDLHPDHLVVDPGRPGELLPALWSFRTRLLGTSGTREVALGSGASVLLPPREMKVPFAAPRVREFSAQARRRAELLIERVSAESDGSGRYRIEATLRDPHGLHLRPSTHDWLLLAIPDGAEELGVASLVVRLDPRLGSGPGGEIRVTSEPVVLAPAAARRIARSGGLHLPLVRYRVYPRFTDGDDAFSLGVIFLRLLMVNDTQDLSAVAEVVAGTVRRATAAAPVPVRSGSFLVESALSAALAAHPNLLTKSNLFYRQIDRVPDRPHAVPDTLWRGVLMMAFRLIEMGINPPAQTAPVESDRLDAVRAEGEGLQRQLHAVLFRRQGLNLEVQALIEELAASDPAKQH
ncbi:MAG: hypothetical protein KA072_11130 [Thermoanaerobaculaceae bacterium]|nr:hypothetical protein [Thermoanaerobaculaceae bacterium]MDI9620310.1 hypothetical protein [Acidobacteriota bacterium]NLH11413.1 hypothetical protein [Holophagae bacterium]HPW55785.1 hypothetical protein [Thermoanaerobaculaceae bacterium]